MSDMKLFVLDREEDETGISGTGIIAEGVQFSNGKCALNWLSEHTSTAIEVVWNDVMPCWACFSIPPEQYQQIKPREFRKWLEENS